MGPHGTIHQCRIVTIHRHTPRRSAPEPVGAAVGAAAAATSRCCCCWPRAAPTARRRVRVGDITVDAITVDGATAAACKAAASGR